MVKTLQGQKTLLTSEVNSLKSEKEKLETIIKSDKILLQQALSRTLLNLKQQRPDLFILTDQDQIVLLTRLILGFITK